MLPEFDFLQPKSLPEALAMLAADVMPIAGGTNVIADLRAEKHHPRALIDLSRLAELRGIHRENGHIVIGGGTTITELLREPLVVRHAPVLAQAARVFANPLIRNRATVGGNLVDASPAADTAPPLLALDAEVELTGRGSARWVPLAEFFTGVRATVRRPDELLTAIRWPLPTPHTHTAFYKLGLRKADAISVVSVAVAVTFDDAGRCAQARIALGAVAPQPIRAVGAEEILKGERLTPAVITEAGRRAGKAIRPISDIRGSAAYRREVTEVIVRRLLNAILAEVSA